MKKLILLFALIFSACFNADNVKLLNTDEFKARLNSDYLIIDTRIDSYYNGFSEDGAKNGGHIKGALNISALSMDFVENKKFEEYFKGKGITKGKKLVFYGSNLDEIKKVSSEFLARGYKGEIYADFIDYANNNDLVKLKNYQLAVYPKWLNDLMQGKKVESFDGKDFMVFEVSWGENSDEYSEHIKGAYHFNTDLIENAPVWNLSDAKTLENNLLNLGITSEKTIILYSKNQMAALRVFFALKYAGVKDVRFLNGGLYSWQEAGFSIEKTPNIPNKESDFKAIIPANANINISMPDDIKNYKGDLKLVSIRAWDEFIGKISGYDYIPKSGEPKGAIWGFAGTNSSNVADYYDPDGTLRNPYEIYELWQSQGINKNDNLAFYCGTGWRASVAWFIALLDGWENIYVYDGGWNAWQMDESLEVQKNLDLVKPDSKNDYGAVFKEGASCKS
ncbi:rhodanese-like domain-containing protein [Campylobacter sp. RM12637]|uniref:rhodanese-like domain-containing protein n=1 Tax=Campylobacter sp. RM12637 TaxID=2735734 RepID=UPI00301519BD|nr:sulfurtransferase [Campylobacter sp. RM12637]